VVRSEPNTAGLSGELRPLVEHCLAKDPRRRPTAAQLLAAVSGATSVVHPQAHQATERAARAVLRRDHAPERVPTAPRPDPAYQERVTQTQRHRDGPEPYLDRPVAEPVPPWVRPGVGPPPARRQSPRRGWLIAAAAIAVLASAGAGVFVAGQLVHARAVSGPVSSATSPAANSATANSATATPPPGTATMATLGSYLTRSASVRPTVQAALDSVRSCSESPASGEATLQQAITIRQDILNGLRTLSVSGLPHGAQLVSTLTSAMQSSIEADQDYQGWMADAASSGGGCRSAPSQDAHYAAGTSASAAATTAKNAFVAIWDPMAPRYGQPTYSSTDF